ncbi:MAG TPA: alpha/beta hydrolase [Herpetosiphonaceae bacterium]
MLPIARRPLRRALSVLIILIVTVGLASSPSLHIRVARAAPPPATLAERDWAAIRALLPVQQQAYLKAAQVSPVDNFGYSVAISRDTVVVGVPLEDGSTAGVQNTATPTVDEGAANAGAAYVFVRSGTTWVLQAYLKASQVSPNDYFGASVAAWGDTIVVGAFLEDSGTAGVQNTATPTVDETVIQSGAAYVFVRIGATWHQQAYLKASQVSVGDNFGTSVAIAGDTIVVGAPYEDGSAPGVQNTATPVVNEAGTDAGAAYVFVRRLESWSQQAYVKASQVSVSDRYGISAAAWGDIIVVGADYEDSGTSGVQNTATPTVDETAQTAGAAFVYARSGEAWSQQAYLKASQVSPGDRFGGSVAAWGETVVVGALQEDGSAAGVQNSATPTVDESATDAGAAFVYARSGAAWSQQAYLKASQVSPGDRFGGSVAAWGDMLVVGAYGEDSSTAGAQNTATPTVDETATDAGAAFAYGRSGTAWSQQAYLKASQVSASDYLGWSVAAWGDTFVVGAFLEDSGTAGVQNTADPTVDETASSAGAAMVYAGGGAPPASARTYLPMLFEFQPKPLATLNPTPIPQQPVTTPGAPFYTATVTLPNPLPAGGAFYLSGSPAALTPGLVDDGLIMTAGGQEIFRHDYGATTRPTPALVPVPRAALAPWAGQAVTVRFVDFHGSVTQASALYLVWQP